ncbi:hypothetical protein, partial [Bacillus cereus]|uniref:hypothetical protein n=1 Tax=Bacillus cereus TaxID=1396 RepID=UPI001E2C8423
HCYQNKSCPTLFFSFCFKHRMGLKEALSASMLGRILSPTLKKTGFLAVFHHPHLNHCYQNKKSPTLFFSFCFKHRMGLKEALSASMLGRILSPTLKKKGFLAVLYLHK